MQKRRHGGTSGAGRRPAAAFHLLATILRLGQWNSLRRPLWPAPGSSTRPRMLAAAGFVPRQAWRSHPYAGPCSPPLVATTAGATPALGVIRPAALATCSLRRPPWARRTRPRPRPQGQRAVPGRGAASVAGRPEGGGVHRAGLRRRPACGGAPLPRRRRPESGPPWPMRRPPSRIAACPRLTSR
jgi:hypothetical protein